MVGRMGPEGVVQELGETLEEATMTLVERVAQWPEQWRREGMAEGRREGVAEGVAEERRKGIVRERALLRRLAAVRFGDATGDRLGVLLADIDVADRLAAVEELILSAGDGPDLIDGVARLLRQSS